MTNWEQKAKQYQEVGVRHITEHIQQIIEIRRENGEFLYHLARFALDGKRDDAIMYVRRIANRLKGSDTSTRLLGLLAERKVTGSPLRDFYCPRCDGIDAAHNEDCPRHPENCEDAE